MKYIAYGANMSGSRWRCAPHSPVSQHRPAQGWQLEFYIHATVAG